MLNTS